MRIHQQTTNKLAAQLSLFSFGFGTLVFLLILISPHTDAVLLLAVLFIFAAIALNTIMLLLLVFSYIQSPFERQEIAIRIFLLLCNIPIAALYTFIIQAYAFKSSF